MRATGVGDGDRGVNVEAGREPATFSSIMDEILQMNVLLTHEHLQNYSIQFIQRLSSVIKLKNS